MPIFDPNRPASTYKISGTPYGFSGTRVDHLDASEYTLVAIAADTSGSVHSFERDIEACLAAVVEACRLSPRADHLLMRLSTFASAVDETHGFRPIGDLDPQAYANTITAGGGTALYDAAHNTVASVVRYGEQLADKGLVANAILFVITDGEDNASQLTPQHVQRAVVEAVGSEALESVLTVLVGVNVGNPGVARYLVDFSARAGFDHYLPLANADARTLAGLADFVSRSIVTTSMVLGSGGRPGSRPIPAPTLRIP